jgi:hypothetical protein
MRIRQNHACPGLLGGLHEPVKCDLTKILPQRGLLYIDYCRGPDLHQFRSM